jgi:hypothetical protein
MVCSVHHTSRIGGATLPKMKLLGKEREIGKEYRKMPAEEDGKPPAQGMARASIPHILLLLFGSWQGVNFFNNKEWLHHTKCYPSSSSFLYNCFTCHCPERFDDSRILSSRNYRA